MDNKQLVHSVVLPGIEEVNKATVAEITELKLILERYNELLSRIVRDRLAG
jgi:hypothetical protein